MNPATKKLQPIKGKNKRHMVISALTSLAREIGVGGKLPTMQELSRLLHVAIGTLDDCLAHLESRGIILRKHGSGIYVTPRIMQKRIGLVFGRNIFSSGASPFYSILLERCIAKAREHNARFSFYLNSPDLSGIGGNTPVHQDLVDALEEKKLDGLMTVCRDSIEQEEWLVRQDIPVVSLAWNSVNSYRVSVDNELFVELAVEALVQDGCKTIGIIGVQHQQEEHFRKALKKHGLPWRREWVCCPSSDNVYLDDNHREQAGRRGVLQLFKNTSTGAKSVGGLPDGLVVADDMMTRGVCAQFGNLGWSVSKDIRIASHANKGSVALAEWDSELILVEVDPQEIVDSLFDMLESVMDGRAPSSRCILLKPSLRPTPRQVGTLS